MCFHIKMHNSGPEPDKINEEVQIKWLYIFNCNYSIKSENVSPIMPWLIVLKQYNFFW